MSEDSAFPEGVLVPISGLLAVVFAVGAGASAPAALSGDVASIVATVVFAGASVGLMVFRYRHGKRREEAAGEGDADVDEK